MIDEPAATGAAASPSKGAVWDLPTRLFHWLLVALIPFSWWSAEEDHLDWHLWSGLGIMSLLIFRLLWGLFGSSTARFANFIAGPRAVFAYARDMKGWQPVGHSPLGALSVVALLAVIAAQVGLGLFSTDEDGLVEGPLARFVSLETSEWARDTHEHVVFDALLILIGLHVAAILFYRLVLGKKLIGPMVTGRSRLDAGTEPMRPGKAWAAILCAILAIAITRWVIAGAPPFGG